MTFKHLLVFISTCFFFSGILLAQQIAPVILEKQWEAFWISVPGESPVDYGVYMFRKQIHITAKPPSFVVHVSADNRYKLFVNEKLVSLGPARGDLSHWNFETVDLSPYLNHGTNTLAALVWNEGAWKPEAQISLQTGFILQGATAAASIVNTDTTWKCRRDSSYSPVKFNIPDYYAAGAGEWRQMAAHPGQWQQTDFDDSQWKKAKTLFHGAPKNILGPWGTTNGWMLLPSAIPPMEMSVERFQKLVFAEGKVEIPVDFTLQKTSLTIPAQSSVTLLLDQTRLTNAYPTLVFSGGKNTSIAISYAEALYSKYPQKGNRNDIKDKVFIGRKDSLISAGTVEQNFTSLTYRTYRYVQIKIVTQNEPLVINDIYGTFTGYPADGSLIGVPQWMFTDWVTATDWKAGVGPLGADGSSAMLDLQLLWAYQVAADLETTLGMAAYASLYQKAIGQLKKTIREKYWDEGKKLLADRTEKDVFSQHTNALAILTGVLDHQQSASMAHELLYNTRLAPASIYFKYYVYIALIKAGLGDDYIQWLDKWRENIASGLTTWAEISDIDKTRSDCHAWGSSPNIEFFRTVLGIDSDGLGFSKVKIVPHLGKLTNVSGEIPHPKDIISVYYQQGNNQWDIQIKLPQTVTGTLVWKGKIINLKEGINQLKEL